MNIVSWNVRGLGRPVKRFLVKDFLGLHLADVCCLQESKFKDISPAMWCKISGWWLNQFLFLPAHGSTGGIVIGWNSVVLTGQLVQVGEFNLMGYFCSFSDHLYWRCRGMYEQNMRSLKLDFWAKLKGCAAESSVSWVICGNFNANFA